MSTQPKTNKSKFWLVFFGLIVVISLIGGGSYALNEAGVLSAATSTADEGERGTPPDFTEDDMPEGMADRAEGGRSSTALLGLGKSVGQLAIIIAVVYYAQKLFGWLERRWQKPKLSGQPG